RLYLYTPLINELESFQAAEMQLLGWRVNNLREPETAYRTVSTRTNARLHYALLNLIPDCASLMDLGCRRQKAAKAFCPDNVNYIPVDFKQYDDEIIACDFNEGEFPDLKVDTCLCAFTAEFVELLPQFLNNMCDAAQKQILMWCRPVDKEVNEIYRWYHPVLVDFTEKFLIETLAKNNFRLNFQYVDSSNRSVIFYDFRRN
ncbi:MAG: hypothetical protein IJP68_01450, partial [Selenomonadaceae bacterium]|nr:hypothetical protein [Selenomonadaceae bacterium]